MGEYTAEETNARYRATASDRASLLCATQYGCSGSTFKHLVGQV
jgi:hypothetical protein